MLDGDQLASLSPLAQQFRSMLTGQLAGVTHTEEFTDRYELVIAPVHPDVGELRVRDDGDELTVSVGLHHWHVPVYLYEEKPEDRRIVLAAESAVDGVRDLLEGRTVLRITRRRGQVVHTTSYSIDYADISPAGPDDTEYLWTGPRGPRLD